MNTASTEVRYAGFWSRSLAALIDILLQSTILLPILYFIFGAEYLRSYLLGPLLGQDIDLGYSSWIINGATLAVVILFWKYKSATPGKMLLGMKLVDADTFQAPSTGRLILRALAYTVSILPLCLGFIWIAFDKRKQGFHDMIARTVVVREK